MLNVERQKDSRALKCILHRTADIPGGVTVSVANLGGDALLEGTPLAKGNGGLFVVVKTAKVIEQAEANATTYAVAKGHHFKAGERFATADCNGQEIASIDKSNPAKDVITLKQTLGAVVSAGTTAFESNGANKTLKNNPIAVAGSSYDVKAGQNLFVDAWVIGVVRRENAPAVNNAIEAELKGVVYV